MEPNYAKARAAIGSLGTNYLSTVALKILKSSCDGSSLLQAGLRVKDFAKVSLLTSGALTACLNKWGSNAKPTRRVRVAPTGRT